MNSSVSLVYGNALWGQALAVASKTTLKNDLQWNEVIVKGTPSPVECERTKTNSLLVSVSNASSCEKPVIPVTRVVGMIAEAVFLG